MSYWYDRSPDVNSVRQMSVSASSSGQAPIARNQIAAPGLRMPSGSSAPLDPLVELHRLGPELARQPGPFQPADAVLAGDGAAEPDGQIHDLAERLLGALAPSPRRRGRRRSAGGCCRRRRARSPRSSRRGWRRSSRPRRPDRPARAAARRRPRAAASPWPPPRGSRTGARPRTPHPRPGRGVENTSVAPCSVNTLGHELGVLDA